MTFIKSLIYKLLNKQISNIYNKRFSNYNNTPKGVFWNSKLSQDLRLNIILDKILKIAKDEEFSIADIGCGYGRLYEVIKERNLNGKVQYYGFDINQKLINFCKNNKNFEHVEYAISAFPFKNTDYVVMSGTYNLTPTNNISLWEDYIIKNLTSNWKLVKKAMIFNCLIKEKKEINKALYYTELSWMKRICENNFGKIQILKNQLLKDDITIVIKKSI
jgi:SAM-dependent methyltransferase